MEPEPTHEKRSTSRTQENFQPFEHSSMDARRAWATALMDLKQTAGSEPYLRGSRLLARDGDELVVGAASAYAAEWLGRRLAHRAAQVLSALGGESLTVRFVSQTEWSC